MLITCWGSRGSIPVSGREYLKYGGDTTCIEIQAGSGDIIIIDAGTGIRRLGNKLIKEGIQQYNFLFTHAHWDHIMGLPFFKPLYRRQTKINVFRCPYAGMYAEKMITRVLTPPHFPVKYSDLSAEFTYEEGCPHPFQIGSVTVVPIHLSHPNGGRGFKFIENDKSFVFLTDNELGYIHPNGLTLDDYAEFSMHADLLIHDAEFTPEEYQRYIEWGHSSIADVLELGIKAQAKTLGLFHLNQDRTDNAMDDIVTACRQEIARKDVHLECIAIGSDMSFEL
jgi:phosphoribosyl 1,2-cyclic phosphodiesterase